MPFPPALGLVKGILIAKLLAPPKKEKKSYHQPQPSYRHQQPSYGYQVANPRNPEDWPAAVFQEPQYGYDHHARQYDSQYGYWVSTKLARWKKQNSYLFNHLLKYI